MNIDKPKLNPIEAFPVEHEGQRLICLRDPNNVSDKVMLLSRETVYIISLFDGQNTIEDIQKECEEKFGERIPDQELAQLIGQLDDALFLDSKRFSDHQNKIAQDFYTSIVRPSSQAGLSYPIEKAELVEWFEKFFKEAQHKEPFEKPVGTLKGLISPHIDYTRGGHLYAKAYRELDESCSADTYIIFGTSHYAQVDNPFILTRKSFETPFGIAESDSEIIDRLETQCNWDLFEGEIAHRTEHSIEFQVAFLQYVLGEQKNYKIVPILCNSFFSLVQEGKSPSQDERVSKFLDSFSKIINELGDKAFIIAGVDMAHVGPKFGDREEVNEEILTKIEQRDIRSLEFSEKLDAEGFYRSVEEEKDWRRVCGLSSIYATLSTINADNGKLLGYDQALEPDTGSVVSFASLGFYS
ncbi:MAG: AmmeMemoRadiSam system protein B [Thermodesulfobacteriota bacterium]